MPTTPPIWRASMLRPEATPRWGSGRDVTVTALAGVLINAGTHSEGEQGRNEQHALIVTAAPGGPDQRAGAEQQAPGHQPTCGAPVGLPSHPWGQHRRAEPGRQEEQASGQRFEIEDFLQVQHKHAAGATDVVQVGAAANPQRLARSMRIARSAPGGSPSNPADPSR